jgi:hypothetical protein
LVISVFPASGFSVSKSYYVFKFVATALDDNF